METLGIVCLVVLILGAIWIAREIRNAPVDPPWGE